jgi:hypothetical protein
MSVEGWKRSVRHKGDSSFDVWHLRCIVAGASTLSIAEVESWKAHLARAGLPAAPPLPDDLSVNVELATAGK